MRILIVLGIFLYAFVTPTHAHSWYSSSGCCGGQDCRVVELGELEFTIREDGTAAWLVVETGELIPVEQTRPSPNEQSHRCEYLVGMNKGKTRHTGTGENMRFCLWVSSGT